MQNIPSSFASLENHVDHMRCHFGAQAAPRSQEAYQAEHPIYRVASDTHREAQRVFKQRELQHQPIHPVFLFIQYFIEMISKMITSFFEQGDKKEKQQLLFLANSLKNNGYITQKCYLEFKEAAGEGEEALRDVTKQILKNLLQKKYIDKKTYFHLIALAHGKNFKKVLQHLFALSSISHVNQFEDQLQSVVSPKERLELLEMLKRGYDKCQFSDDEIEKISNLTARVEVCQWLEQQGDSETKEALMHSLRLSDAKLFETAMVAHLEHLSGQASNTLKKTYFQEMADSFHEKKATSSFVHFSQVLESQYVLKDWEKKLDVLEAKIIEVNGDMTLEAGKAILKELKELYCIFGKVLENERECAGSALLVGYEQGKLKERWQRIGQSLHRVVPQEVSGHDLCGCLHDESLNRAWPGVEQITPIQRTDYIPAHEREGRAEQEKKKVLILTCSWGGGHNSVSQALQASLGKRGYHTSICDVPETTLLTQDLLHTLVGPKHSTATFYNTLMAGGHLPWINFVRKMFFGMEASQASKRVAKALIREQFLKDRPDVVVSTYGATHIDYFVEVAKELGIPILNAGPDIDMRNPGLTKPPEYAHFRTCMPYDVEEVRDELLKLVPENQIEVTGYPVRPEYNRVRTPEQIRAIREKYHIEDDRDVVVISNGRAGADNPWPRILANAQAGDLAKKLHVIVICGGNEDYKKSLEDYLADHPNDHVSFHIHGWANEEEGADFKAIAKVQVGKKGGGDVAEGLAQQNFFLFDNRQEAATWEEYAGQVLEQEGLALRVYQESEFLGKLNQLLNKEVETNPVFHRRDSEENYVQIINDMIERAESDPECQEKRAHWGEEADFFPEHVPQREPLTYHQGMNFLSKSLKDVGNLSDLEVPPETIEALIDKKPVGIDFTTLKLKELDSFDPSQARLCTRYFIHALEKGLAGQGMDIAVRDLDMATLFLEQLVDRKDLNFREEVIYLDRLILASKMSGRAGSLERFCQDYNLEQTGPHVLPRVQLLYKTQEARQAFKEWVEEKLSRGRKKGSDERLMDQKSAILSYVFHPDQVNYIRDLELHRMASRFDHVLDCQDDGVLCFRFDGQPVPVSELMEKTLTPYQGRILDWTNGEEYIYHHAEGLKKIENGQHPADWQAQLPIFRTKARKTQDYRIELKTDMSTPVGSTWLVLKNPEGDVYSVQMTQDNGFDNATLNQLKVTPGFLKSGPKSEFLGHENHLRTTKVAISEQQFRNIKNYLEEKQRRQSGYNPHEQNDASLVMDVFEQLGVKIPGSVDQLQAHLPLPEELERALIRSSLLKHTFRVLFYPLTVIRNIVAALLFGAYRDDPMLGEWGKARFDSFWSVFDEKKVATDSARMVGRWQEVLQEWHGGRRVIPLNELLSVQNALGD